MIVVNDGSGREYEPLFEKTEADKIITHAENLGKGSAIKTGLNYVRENYAEPYVAVTVDADGQHETGNVLNVTRAAAENPGTLVIGSRRLGKDAPFRSKSGNFITRKVLHALTPVTVYPNQRGAHKRTVHREKHHLALPHLVRRAENIPRYIQKRGKIK